MVTDCVPRARDDDIRASVAFATAVILVIAATATVRLWPLLTRQMLGGVLEYDDGVYYNAAAHLAGGALPYRDFVFLQPPGITLLLAPVVGLARLIGDPAAFVLARLGIVAVASVNVFLLMRLIRRWSGPVAAHCSVRAPGWAPVRCPRGMPSRVLVGGTCRYGGWPRLAWFSGWR